MPKKRVAREMNVYNLVSDASDEAEGLKEELENWRDGMSGTNLENTEKFAEIEEAINQLDTAYSTLQEALDYNEELMTDINANESLIKPKSRPKRLSRIIANISNVIERLDETIEGLEKEADKSGDEATLTRKDELNDFKDEVGRTLDELEAVEIPVPFR